MTSESALTRESTLYLSAFIDELVRSGLRNMVVSPGSRSTPLAVLAAEHPEMKVWMNIDERSSGYFALGMAKARREAVALLCTSGTAAANYMPAVAEAYLSRVPLVVLTADRPHELRDVGAPQTIRQIGLYGNHVKWFMEMPIPEAESHMVRHARMTASRAVATALSSPGGPVHLNFPLREPLVPDLHAPELFGAGRDGGQAYTRVGQGGLAPKREALQQLAQDLSVLPRGIIVCGPHDAPGFAEAVTQLAEQLKYPVLADPLSQLRSGSHSTKWVIDAYDAFLRDEKTAERLRPDVVIRFGGMPVSKPLLQYLNRHADCRYIVVDEGDWRDPTLLASDMLYADPAVMCRMLSEMVAETGAERDGVSWSGQWRRINRETRTVLEEAVEETGGLFEGKLFVELNRLMPPGTVLFAGNSMPVRDLDTFFESNNRNIRIMGNRGANGIDGLISTALGVSSSGCRTVLVLGDLSFYHDMNGLLAAKLHGLSITIIIVNNDGGGIFSFLPQAGLPRHFETLFGTPTGLDFSYAAAMYGGTFKRIDSWETFREAFQQALSSGGLQVIEVPSERKSNVEMHRNIWRKLSEHLVSLTEKED